MRGREPGLELQPAACQKRWAIALRSASGSPRNQPRVRRRLGQQLVDEGPVGLGERRRVVAVDDVDLLPPLPRPAAPPTRTRSGARRRSARGGRRGPRSRPCGRCATTAPARGARMTDAGSTAKAAIPGAATTRSAWIVDPSSRCATRSSARVFTRRGSGVEPSRSANQSAYAMNVSTGIGASSHPPVNASNVCTPAASRCHSRPDRSSIPSGMLRRQNRIGSPTTVTDSPCRRASAATASPYGPAPMTSSSMRRRILAACESRAQARSSPAARARPSGASAARWRGSTRRRARRARGARRARPLPGPGARLRRARQRPAGRERPEPGPPCRARRRRRAATCPASRSTTSAWRA